MLVTRDTHWLLSLGLEELRGGERDGGDAAEREEDDAEARQEAQEDRHR